MDQNKRIEIFNYLCDFEQKIQHKKKPYWNEMERNSYLERNMSQFFQIFFPSSK